MIVQDGLPPHTCRCLKCGLSWEPAVVREWREPTDPSTVLETPMGGRRVIIPTDTLTLVAPPLPPEPPLWTVVYVDGTPYQHRHIPHSAGHWWSPDGWARWSDIADQATPAVPLADVVQALVEFANEPMPSRTGNHNFSGPEYEMPAERIERLFGWPR